MKKPVGESTKRVNQAWIASLTLIFLCACAFTAEAYEWQRNYQYGTNTTTGESSQQTSDGGFIVAGTTYGPAPQVYLLKTDFAGIKQWEKTYQPGADWKEFGKSVLQTAGGGYLVAGNRHYDKSPVPPDLPYKHAAVLWKTDAQGNLVSKKIFAVFQEPETNVEEVQPTKDGGYIVVGHTYNPGATKETKIWLLKVDAECNKVWEKLYTPHTFNNGYSVQQTSDDGYILTGDVADWIPSPWSGFVQAAHDVILMKTDSQGNETWTKYFGRTGVDAEGWAFNDFAYSVRQTTDGGYILTGDTPRIVEGKIAGGKLYLVKTLSDGSLEWEKNYADHTAGRCVRQTRDGGYIIAGEIYYGDWPGGNYNAYLLKTNVLGEASWNDNFGTPNWNESAKSVQELVVLNEVAYIICGNGLNSALLIYYKPNLWELTYNSLLSPGDLEILRAYRDDYLAKDAVGSLFLQALYNNSEAALDVLLTNPDLINEVRNLIQANLGAVEKVLTGQEAVVSDTDKILTFLDDFAQKSPSELDSLATSLKKEMARRKKKKQKFMGFTLK